MRSKKNESAVPWYVYAQAAQMIRLVAEGKVEVEEAIATVINKSKKAPVRDKR